LTPRLCIAETYTIPSSSTRKVGQHLTAGLPRFDLSLKEVAHMAKSVLVIDSDDWGPFNLRIEGGALVITGTPEHPGAVLRGLNIARIRCEVEVADDGVVVGADGAAGGQAFQPGQILYVGNAELRLESAAGNGAASPPTNGAPAAAPAPGESEAGAASGPVFKRLFVVDGADRGLSRRLPEAGTVTVGNSSKHADVVLHDLYVSRVHCLVDVRDGRVFVTHSEGKKGTLINGQTIAGQQELHLGDILRVGNSHIKLEIATAEDEPPAEEEDEVVEAVEEHGEGALALASSESSPARDDTGGSGVDRLTRLEGEVLGQYRVGPLLGRGHSGLIFRAQHLKTNLVVGLKVLSGDFPADGDELQRFVGALKIASGIHHANLVTYYGAGRSGPYCWLAREYVDGESASRMVKALAEGAKPNWTRAARVAVGLARALACLQEQRVLHGNITPRNVLVRASDRTTKLTDLMLGQALDGSRFQQTVLEKKVLAELPYMAPEQLETGTFVDHLADLYAVGAVVYALLTGRPPFVGQSPEETISLIRTAKLVRPGAHQRGIPAALDAVVLKLLARQQENRYQTATELLADVEPLVEDEEGN
jgi:pSer/pThr/pTyr-binding forkhead associated (FHA) protein